MTSTPDWIIKRAGGRRRYNAQRQQAQAARRVIVAGLIADEYQADIARLLGVSRSTICRDVAAISANRQIADNCEKTAKAGFLDKQRKSARA